MRITPISKITFTATQPLKPAAETSDNIKKEEIKEEPKKEEYSYEKEEERRRKLGEEKQKKLQAVWNRLINKPQKYSK